MLDGAKILVMYSVPVQPGSRKRVTFEEEYVIKKFRNLLPEGETPNGYREEPILQFYAREGGMRTVAKSMVLDIR